ncbi:hypothetical protein HPB49_006385 [Dermacentor silvarum]|uniref:Uncharacterized protein n=1 Tax=Dermacentor silvarum TaxID=543639 RepID=A0ACB8CQA6_DERSI|nr:hypothetical protein HPB49_006385 [Dermacentor silvarum]
MHGDTIQALQTQTQQATRLIQRLAHRRAGLRERNTLRLTGVYITSRTAYAFPYLPLKQKERDRINALLRSCTKVTLCLTPSTSTARLLNLGTHNTFEALAGATLTAHLTRLLGTATGCTLLCQLGIASITHPTEAVPLPPYLYSHLVIPPIPKNMHPEHDGKCRAARAKAIHKQYGDSSEVAYVDVATYSSGSRVVLTVVNNQARLRASGSSPQTHLKLQRQPMRLLSSPPLPLKFFPTQNTPNQISPKAWYPAPRPGLLGNEEVHSLARGLTFRAGVGPPPPALERLLTFRDIVTYYRDTQHLYAPPTPSLTLTQPSHWRRPQTGTAPYPILLHARYPDQFLSSCKLCGKLGDFLHVILTCPTFPHPPFQATAESYWETLLASSTATEKRLIIAAAMKRIALQGLSFAL